ncbi:hypothetical protein Tco_0080558 [Tanacetum coccineum]
MAISSSSSSSSSDKEVQNCSKQCLESFKTLQKNFDSEREKHSRARLEIQGYELALESLESRILGHEKNKLAWGEKYEFQNYELKCREVKIDNLKMELEKVVKERDELKVKIEKWEESSKGLNKILNSQMSAKDKNSLGYGTQLDEMSNKSKTDSEISMSVFEVRSSDEEITQQMIGLDEYVIRKKIIESKTTELNTDTSKSKTSETVGKTNEVNIEKPKSVHESVVPKPKINRDKVIIEDWYSNDEDDVSAVKTKEGIRFKKIKACFVCKSTDHLIKDCNFYAKKSPEPKLKTMVNTGQRVVKPVWDNAKRVNNQKFSNNLKYPQVRRTFVLSEVLTKTCLVNPVRPNGNRAVHIVSTARPISTARPVSTARPFAPKIAQTSSAIRPIYPRMDNVRPRASYSPIKRSYYTKSAFRPKNLKQDVKTSRVKNMTTAGTRAVVNTGKGKMYNALKKSRWVWRPKGNYMDHESKEKGSFILKKFEYVDPKGISKSVVTWVPNRYLFLLLFVQSNPEICLQDHAVVDSGCSNHMTGNKAYVSINIASAVICLATNQKFNFSKLVFDGMLRNLDNTKKKFLMYPRFLMVFLNNQIELGEPFNDVYPIPAHNLKVFTNMSRKGLKFLEKITPLFPNMLTHAAKGEDSRDSLEGTNGNKGDQVQTPHDSPLSGGHTSDRVEGVLNLQELSFYNQEVGKKCKPSISHHRAWLKSVKRLSMKKRFGKKESVSKQGRKKSKPKSTLDDSTVFDDQDADHGMEYMETEEAADEGNKSSSDKGGNAEELVSTTRPEVSTARPDIDAARQEDSDVEPRTPPTTTSIFDDEDITMAQTLIKMKKEKAKEKGVPIKDVDDPSRPTRSFLTSKPLPTIDPKDKGKGVLKESPVKKVKRSDLDAAQIAKDAKIARLVHEKELAYMKREREKRQRQDQAYVDYIASLYDEVQAKMDASEELAARLQMEERDALYIKEQEKDADFVPIGSERDEKMIDKMNKKAASMDEKEVPKEPESTKVEVKQEIHEEKIRKRSEEEQLRASLKIVPDEEEIDYEVLGTRKKTSRTASPETNDLLVKTSPIPFTADIPKKLMFSPHHASRNVLAGSKSKQALVKDNSNPLILKIERRIVIDRDGLFWGKGRSTGGGGGSSDADNGVDDQEKLQAVNFSKDDLEADTSSYHCNVIPQIPLESIDLSFAIEFYCQDKGIGVSSIIKWLYIRLLATSLIHLYDTLQLRSAEVVLGTTNVLLSVLIPETTFVGVESRVLIPETTFVGVESRVLILETTVWDTLVYPSDTLVILRAFAISPLGLRGNIRSVLVEMIEEEELSTQTNNEEDDRRRGFQLMFQFVRREAFRSNCGGVLAS